MIYKIGDIVKFNEKGVEGIGILYENGNKSQGHDDFRVQDITTVKHKYLGEGDISEAMPAEIKAFIKDAGVPLSKATILAREAGEVGLTVEEFEAWANEGVKPQKWIDAEAKQAEGGNSMEDEGEDEDE